MNPLDWVGLAAAVAVLVSFAAAVAIGKFIRAGRGPDPRK